MYSIRWLIQSILIHAHLLISKRIILIFHQTRLRWPAQLSTFGSHGGCCVWCLAKSTYARTGIVINVTPFEPEWQGFVTIEISNTTPLPARIYANEGIARCSFESDEDCAISYADKAGKYQNQVGVVPPKM